MAPVEEAWEAEEWETAGRAEVELEEEGWVEVGEEEEPVETAEEKLVFQKVLSA